MVPLQGSPHALPNRLDVRPAAVMGQLCAAVCPRVPAQSPPPLPPPGGAPVRERFPGLASGEGSTRAARRQQTAAMRERTGLVWAGKMRVLVAACSHRPLWQVDTADAAAHDQRVAAERLAALPVGGLVVCALGVCSVLWCDDFTDQQPGFVTRMRVQTAYRTVQRLSPGLADRDASIQVGQDRSHPCRPPGRMVAVRWPGAWSR